MTPSPNPFADEPLPQQGPRLESAGDAANPYAAPVGIVEPRSESGPGVGIWRHRELVVIHRDMNFPERCIWTNERAMHRWSSEYTVGLWNGIAPISVRFAFSLSPGSRRKMLFTWLRGPALLAIGVLLLFIASVFDGPIGAGTASWRPLLVQTPLALGIGLLIAGLIVTWWYWRPLSLIHHHGPYCVLHGAKRPFLQSLPPWPGVYAIGKRTA